MIKLVSESLNLDIDTLSTDILSFSDKLKLIWKKYAYFISRRLGFNLLNKGVFLSQEFYFPNKYGYVGIQRIIVDSDYLVEALPQRLNILDIGAHAGEFSFFAKNFLKAKKIISVEPYSKVYEILELNKPKDNYRYAVTSKKNAILNLSEISSQLNSLKSDKARNQKGMEKVPTIKLSELLKKEKTKFNLLKIDTEGTEIDVLKSGGKSLKEFKYLLIEVELKDDYFEKFKEILEIAEGFKLKTIGKFGEGERSVDLVFEKVQ